MRKGALILLVVVGSVCAERLPVSSRMLFLRCASRQGLDYCCQNAPAALDMRKACSRIREDFLYILPWEERRVRERRLDTRPGTVDGLAPTRAHSSILPHPGGRVKELIYRVRHRISCRRTCRQSPVSVRDPKDSTETASSPSGALEIEL